MAGDFRFDTSDGVEIFCRQAGRGRPAILLHPLMFDGRMWSQSDTFDLLAKRFRVLAPDLRGHGKSGKPHDPTAYGLRMVSDISELAARFADGAAHVVGYSIGAEIALRLAVLAPERVRSLVVAGSGWSGGDEKKTYRALADSLDTGSLHAFVYANAPAGAAPPDEQAIEEIDGMLAGQDAVALAGVCRGMPEIIGLSRDELGGLAMPVLGISGSDDRERPNLDSMAGVVARYALRILPGRDHLGALQDKALGRAILDFLDEMDAAPGSNRRTAE